MAKKQGLIYVLQSESLPHNICKIGQTINWIGENFDSFIIKINYLTFHISHLWYN